MDDLTAKITGLLNDPEGLEKIKAMASGLMGESAVPQGEKSVPEENEMPLDPSQMAGLVKAASLFKGKSGEDENTRLLKALKPHLSEERCAKVDKAISLLKIVRLLPLLKDSGVLNLFGS